MQVPSSTYAKNRCCNHDLVTKGTLHVQQTWYPGLLLLLDPPPPFPSLTVLCVLLVRVSKHLMQPNNLVMGYCLFDTPTIFFVCIAGLRVK